MFEACTVNRRLSALHQGEGPILAPLLELVSMVTVPAMAAVPGAAQGDVDPYIEGPMTLGHIKQSLGGSTPA